MVSFDKQKIKELLDHIVDKLEVGELIERAKEMVKAFDWNPFKLDDPEQFESAWQEAVHNFVMIKDFLAQVVYTVEMMARDFQRSVSGPEKLEVAAKFCDDVIRLPFYLEWLDRPILRLLLSLTVTQLNEVLGQEWPENEEATL